MDKHRANCLALIGVVGLMFTSSQVVASGIATYPPISSSNTYTITPADAQGLTIDTLYLPDGFVLKVDPSVSSIDWTVTTLKFGKGALFDLSAPVAAPRAAPSVKGGLAQANPCTNGLPGFNAPPAQERGASGVSLTINGLQHIQADGSLWIKTDGGPGQAGGAGGRGEQGGGKAHHFLHKCIGNGGGQGGKGGDGAAGGDTASVNIQWTGAPEMKLESACDRKEWPSTAPPAVSGGATGVVAIYGAPGPGGAGGSGGPGGLGGDKGIPGPPGPVGHQGASGQCVITN